MKNGIPLIWWRFRYAWTVLHLILVVALAIWLAAWLTEGGRGERVYYEGYFWVQDLSSTLASAIPFPWS